MKAIFNKQCKEAEENKKMGQTRVSLQENWRYQGKIALKDGHDKGQKR